MKKIVSFLLLLTLSAGAFKASAFTPEDYYKYPNDIAVCYGVASIQTFVSLLAGTMLVIPTAIDGMQFNGFHSTGCIGVSYHRSLGKTVSVGGTLSYTRVYSGFHGKEDPAVTGKFALNWIVAMAASKFYWFKKPGVAMYTKVGLGAGMSLNRFTKKDADGTQGGSSNVVWAPAAQLSPVGIEFGGRFRGFVELGVGMEGILNAGVKYYL